MLANVHHVFQRNKTNQTFWLHVFYSLLFLIWGNLLQQNKNVKYIFKTKIIFNRYIKKTNISFFQYRLKEGFGKHYDTLQTNRRVISAKWLNFDERCRYYLTSILPCRNCLISFLTEIHSVMQNKMTALIFTYFLLI